MTRTVAVIGAGPDRRKFGNKSVRAHLAAISAPIFEEAAKGLFLIGLLPAAFTLVIRGWVPESPHWLMSQGRREEARRSIAWVIRSGRRSRAATRSPS